MANLTDIVKLFEEEYLQNTLKGNLKSGNITNWENKPMFVTIEKIDYNEILFTNNIINDTDIKPNPFRVKFENGDLTSKNFISENTVNFQFLFWISRKNEGSVEIKYLRCGIGTKFGSDLDIGFGENFIANSKVKRIEKISEDLERDFVFENNGNKFLFIQTYIGKSDLNYTIYAQNKRADILVSNNKWIIQKIVNKPFPKKFDDFLQLNIAKYKNINFVESSKTKEAYEAIRVEEARGNTLISLWRIYSDIELERSKLLKAKVGELTFSISKHLPDNVTKIKITDAKSELKSILTEHKDDLLRSALEICSEEFEKEANKSADRFIIKAINEDFSLEIIDEYNILPKTGNLVISALGDEIVHKRRERALKYLSEAPNFITRNLLLAIEDRADAMIDKKRREKPLTERTRKFLKEKFGIDKLTKNQEEAIDIAINTPDIAVIQGPPGTGKTTVVAAICERLIEIAEKNNRNSGNKQILVSAFQNDTVEHIASKIYTMGLPTIKIGKETQSNIKSEEKFIESLKLSIDNEIKKHSALSNSFRISKELKRLKNIYKKEKNDAELKQHIKSLIFYSNTIFISEQLEIEWKELDNSVKNYTQNNEKYKKLLNGLKTLPESYSDGGYKSICRITQSDFPLEEEEKLFLKNAPIDEPTNEFLEKLKELKEKYLAEINTEVNYIATGNNLSLIQWLDKAIYYFTLQEETSYNDYDTFILANLEAIREDLEGNTEYIKETINNYSESLAVTNQVAGSKEMSNFNSIENIILEEAARSNPLDLLIPMTKATERIILVGDQNQLPHILEDDIAEETSEKVENEHQITDTRKKLQESLFGVIFRNLADTSTRRTVTLTEQFRMHPFIGDFISREYYNNKLVSGISNQAELKKHGLQVGWAKDKVTVFCNVSKNKGLELDGKSKSRRTEAKKIIEILDTLKEDENFENLNVGIITFYASQVDVLFQEAKNKGYAEAKSDGSYEISHLYKETPDKREKLRIGSVDSFQGKEFDIVILSTVRSNNIPRKHENAKRIFGFLTLENRLNVAFSRAQKLLIVVGDGDMFSDEFAKTYVEGLYEFYNQLSNDSGYGNRI